MNTRLHAKILKTGCLTNREAVVLKYLCEGYMRKEIAVKVFRSYGCISKQVESIAEKLDAHSSTEIVAVAIAEGLVEIQIIKPQHHYLLNTVLVFLMVGQMFNGTGRRPPQTPRPAVRLVRRQ